jgi:GT2 family glycosyltransferase
VCAVLTAHDRRCTTLRCLEALRAQSLAPGDELAIVLVDDGSTDGTGAAVAAQHPEVDLVPGDGTLYWTGGMRMAIDAAWRHEPDVVVWLNDDTHLDPDALRRLLRWSTAGDVVVGTVRDPSSGSPTYGGVRRSNRWHPNRFALVVPDEHVQQADTMHGNLVAVPAGTAERVGPLDPRLRHGMADFDYGFRVGAAGGRVLVAPGTFGTCARHGSSERRSPVELATSIKGLPAGDWCHYLRRHGGRFWPVFFVSPYLGRLLRRRPPVYG